MYHSVYLIERGRSAVDNIDYSKGVLSKRDASLLRGLCSRPTLEPDPEPELLPFERCRSARGAGAGRLNL